MKLSQNLSVLFLASTAQAFPTVPVDALDNVKSTVNDIVHAVVSPGINVKRDTASTVKNVVPGTGLSTADLAAAVKLNLERDTISPGLNSVTAKLGDVVAELEPSGGLKRDTISPVLTSVTAKLGDAVAELEPSGGLKRDILSTVSSADSAVKPTVDDTQLHLPVVDKLLTPLGDLKRDTASGLSAVKSTVKNEADETFTPPALLSNSALKVFSPVNGVAKSVDGVAKPAADSLLSTVGAKRDILSTISSADSAVKPAVDDTQIHLPIIDELLTPLGGLKRDIVAPVLEKVPVAGSALTQLGELTQKFKRSIDLDATVGLNGFKKVAHTGDANGHASGLGGSLSARARTVIKNATTALGGGAGRKGIKVNKRTTFDATAQHIDVTGDHAFVAPDFANGDTRGPCPGLNALANHGYLPHNGVASIAEYIVAVNSVFGMGLDIATVLSVYGTIEAGNPFSLKPGFSMGGTSDDSQNLLDNLDGLLGTPRGLSGSHNQYEEDASGTRGDLYDPNGNNYALNMTYFLDLYNMQIDAEEPNYSMEIMGEHNIQRFNQSIAYNPDFFYGPSAGLVVRNAAYAFTGSLFVNTSAEHPDGVLGKEVLKSFFAVTGEEGNFTYNEGCERIPDNWYRRQSDYTFVSYGLDLVTWVTKYPQLLSFGGNTNGVNTFTGIELANLTSGVLNAENLLEGNNLLCFGFQYIKEFAPNSLHSLFATLATPLSMLNDILGTTITSLACPAFKELGINGTDFSEYLIKTYPGAAKSNGAL